MRLREKDPADVHGKDQIRDSCYTSLLLLSHSLLLTRNEREKKKTRRKSDFNPVLNPSTQLVLMG